MQVSILDHWSAVIFAALDVFVEKQPTRRRSPHPQIENRQHQPLRFSPVTERFLAARELEVAMQHAARGEQLLTQVTYLLRGATQYRHFQTMTMSKMDVQSRYDEVMMVMLL